MEKIFTEEENNKIAEARKVLENAGFYVGNLWSVGDVKSKFECDDQEAQDVLDGALQNEATMAQIWDAIDYEGDDMGLTRIEEDAEK